jgi:hypothetical protein
MDIIILFLGVENILSLNGISCFIILSRTSILLAGFNTSKVIWIAPVIIALINVVTASLLFKNESNFLVFLLLRSNVVKGNTYCLCSLFIRLKAILVSLSLS